MKDYQEPELTVAVLDFVKPKETRLCLESVKKHIRFEHKVIYLHNGSQGTGFEYYPYEFYQEGLIDTFVQTKQNNGLGIGTRDLMSLIFSPYTLYLQNDQVLGRDFRIEEFNAMKQALDMEAEVEHDTKLKSIALAGPTAGKNVYSERCHLIKTDFYRLMEFSLPLGPYGAGPFHHGPWREEQIQKYYAANGFCHFTGHYPLVADIGKYTLRDCAGGRVRMRTDTKAVTWEIPPTEKYVFPEHTEEEWRLAIEGKWPKEKIPQTYIDKKESFSCWDNLAI